MVANAKARPVSRPDDALIALRDVPDLDFLPRRRNGGKMSLSTVHRWVHGSGAKGGIRLRALRVGGQWATTKPWLLEFFEALGAAELGTLRPPTPESVQDRTEEKLRKARAL
jgi:hypothetical protein